MSHRIPKPLSRTIALALAALAIPWTSSALAADEVESQILLPPLTISEVFVDLDAELIHVIGSAFGSSPSAHLGDLELEVLTSTDNVLTAALPSLAPGSYRLEVSRGHLLPRQTDVFEVTLGAVGPQGPQGPKGEPGPPGPQGPEGPPGSTGTSEAWFVRNLDTISLPDSGDFVVVAELELPAGSYVFTGSMIGFNLNHDAELLCRIHPAVGFGSHTISATKEVQLTLPGFSFMPVSQVIELQCSTLTAGTTVRNRSLTAIQVTEVHSELF